MLYILIIIMILQVSPGQLDSSRFLLTLSSRRRELELELRQMELRRTNPAWGQMHESIVDHAAIAERKEERAEAERERAREYRSVAAMLELLIREQAIVDMITKY